MFHLCCVNHNLHQFFDEILTKCWSWWNTWYISVFTTSRPCRKAIISGGKDMLPKGPRFPRGEAEPTWRWLGKPAWFHGLIFHIECSVYPRGNHSWSLNISEVRKKKNWFDSKAGFLMFPVVQFSSLTMFNQPNYLPVSLKVALGNPQWSDPWTETTSPRCLAQHLASECRDQWASCGFCVYSCCWVKSKYYWCVRAFYVGFLDGLLGKAGMIKLITTMWGPPVISWLRFAPVTIVI